MNATASGSNRLICFGDSITQGVDLPINQHWPTVLAACLKNVGSPIADVYVKGVGGNTAALAMDRINADLGPLLPAIVLVEFGINDAYVNPWAQQPRSSLENFVTHMESIICYIRAARGKPYFVGHHPLVSHTHKHLQGNRRSIVENLKPYTWALEGLAIKLDVPLLDLHSELGSEFCASLHPDGIHLAGASSALYGEAVFRCLQKVVGLPSQSNPATALPDYA
ncbi:hypothetical protein BH09VER1_BH09VER1_46340 [soil metagenome]